MTSAQSLMTHYRNVALLAVSYNMNMSLIAEYSKFQFVVNEYIMSLQFVCVGLQ